MIRACIDCGAHAPKGEPRCDGCDRQFRRTRATRSKRVQPPAGAYERTITRGELSLDVFVRRGDAGARYAGRLRQRTSGAIITPAWQEYRFASESECVRFHLGIAS